jgi:hypothetical protein
LKTLIPVMFGETRFYVYRPADGQVEGPFAYDELSRLDSEELVAIEGGSEWWPARRWRPDGSLTVTSYDHARAWLALLLVAPLGAYLFWPQLCSFEFFVGWLIMLACDLLLLATSKREYPRFPKSE